MTEKQRSMEHDFKELNFQSIETENRVYKHLGHHPGILKVFSSEAAIEMDYFANGTLERYLCENRVDWQQKYLWIRSSADTISFVHSKGVVHGDIATRNFLVDDDLSLLLMDFGESIILKSGALDAKVNGLSAKTDIFQFGSLIFEIVTGNRYWLDARETETEEDDNDVEDDRDDVGE